MLKPELWRRIDRYCQAVVYHHSLNQQEFTPDDELESSQLHLSNLENDINDILYKMNPSKSKTQIILTGLAGINCLILVYWGIYSGDIFLTGLSGLYPPLIYLINKNERH